MFNRRGFNLIDEVGLTEQQIALMRQIARDEVAVAAETLARRLDGVPTVTEMTMLFERQQQAIHEFISSTDLYLRRAEKEFASIGDIKKDMSLLMASINMRNQQLDEVQRDINKINERASRNSEGLVDVMGKYTGLKISIFGDPDSPEVPSLTAKLNERSHKADEQHEEIKSLLTSEIKPMIEQANVRLRDVEAWVAKQRQWMQLFKNAVKFVAVNPRVIAVIFGGGVIGATVIEFLKAALR